MREVKAHTFEEVLETAKKKAAEFAAKPAEEQAHILKQQEEIIAKLRGSPSPRK